MIKVTQFLFLSAVVLASSPVSAQLDGFSADRFEMAPTVDDGFVLRVPDTLGNLRYSLTGTLGFANSVLRITPDPDTAEGVDVVGPRLSFYLGFAMGISERLEFSVAVPFAITQNSEAGTQAGFLLQEADKTAFGDIRIGASVLAFGDPLSGFQLGLSGMLSVPTGDPDSFTGDGGLGGVALASAGYRTPSYNIVFNAGARFRKEADYITSNQGTELIARGGVIVPVMDDRLKLHGELDASLRASGDDSFSNAGSPLFALFGARYSFENGLHAGAGVAFGITEAPGNPNIRALATVGYAAERAAPTIKDSDGDGLPDTEDKCPLEAEDFDNFEDGDGCPDPDNDSDRILDTDDQCPRVDGETIETTAEVYNKYEDSDGCPDTRPLTLEEIVTLPAPIEFEYDKAILLPGSDVYLRQVLEVLKKHPEVERLEVQGHTSSEGGPEYNLRLSEARAQAVVKWLVKRGIAAGRLIPKGYGLTKPVASNESEEDRQKNRRVQFRLIDGDKVVEPKDPADKPEAKSDKPEAETEPGPKNDKPEAETEPGPKNDKPEAGTEPGPKNDKPQAKKASKPKAKKPKTKKPKAKPAKTKKPKAKARKHTAEREPKQ